MKPSKATPLVEQIAADAAAKICRHHAVQVVQPDIDAVQSAIEKATEWLQRDLKHLGMVVREMQNERDTAAQPQPRKATPRGERSERSLALTNEALRIEKEIRNALSGNQDISVATYLLDFHKFASSQPSFGAASGTVAVGSDPKHFDEDGTFHEGAASSEPPKEERGETQEQWTKREHPVGWIIESSGKEIARFVRQLCPEGEIDKLIAAHNAALAAERKLREQAQAANLRLVEALTGLRLRLQQKIAWYKNPAVSDEDFYVTKFTHDQIEGNLAACLTKINAALSQAKEQPLK